MTFTGNGRVPWEPARVPNPPAVTLSEFRLAAEEEFGPVQARTLCREVVLGEIGHRTPDHALEEGVDPRTVWRALCTAMDVPDSRRHGVGLKRPSH